jgi:acetyl esterase/lipase
MHKLFASLLAVPLLISFTSSAQAQRKYPPVIAGAESHVYQKLGEVELQLWVFKPKGWKAEDTRPGVVFFFGGGWKAGSPEQFVEQCKHLASEGMVTITADYRVASRHGTKAIDCVNDARAAMRWVRSHANELGIDPERLAAGGGSAGGHIAACLGTIPVEAEEVSSRPDAMFLFNPACVLAPINGQQPWKEDRSAEMLERMGVDPVKLSPAHNVTAAAPPAIVFHGKDDPTVPYATAEIFAKKMKAAGVRCDLKGYEGEQHGFFNFGKNENKMFHQTLTDLDEFLLFMSWIELEKTD